MAAITYQETTSNGVQTDFNIIFPFLDRAHVIVSFNGAPQATSTFTFLSDSQIRLNPAAANLVVVRVGRETPQTVLTDFPSSIVTEADLDGGYLQQLYILQELQDVFDDSVASAITVASDLLLLNSLHVRSAAAGDVTASPDADELVIEGNGNVGMSLLNNDTGGFSNIYFGGPANNAEGIIRYINSANTMSFFVGAGEIFRITAGVGAIFNENASAANNFRIESDLNTHMLFVDAGNNSVHIDNSLLTGAGDGDLVMASNKDLRWINNGGSTSANQGITFNASDELELTFETGPVTIGTFTPSDKFIVNINGTRYHIQLDAI